MSDDEYYYDDDDDWYWYEDENMGIGVSPDYVLCIKRIYDWLYGR